MKKLLVKEVMVKQVAVLGPDHDIAIAAGIFKANLFHALPIVDKSQDLVGIITTHDLIAYAFQDSKKALYAY